MPRTAFDARSRPVSAEGCASGRVRCSACAIVAIVAALWAGWSALGLAQQPPAAHGRSSGETGWQTGTQPERRPAAPPTTAAPNTSVIERAAPEQPKRVEARFSASLTAGGPRIEQGLIWRVFVPADGPDAAKPAPPKLVETRREAAPVLALAPGEYIVNVALGKANQTRRLKLLRDEVTIAQG